MTPNVVHLSDRIISDARFDDGVGAAFPGAFSSLEQQPCSDDFDWPDDVINTKHVLGGLADMDATAGGPHHPDTAMSLNNRGALFKAQSNGVPTQPLCGRTLAV